jgi:Flp pilus assembly protein TadB
VIAHAKSNSPLDTELAPRVHHNNTAPRGAGAGLGIAAGGAGYSATAFALATIAAALALVVDWWLALLIVFGILFLLTLLLALLAVRFVKKGTPLAPEQAIEEALLTKQALRSGHAR